jgi:hypothetical protein
MEKLGAGNMSDLVRLALLAESAEQPAEDTALPHPPRAALRR